MLLVAQKHLPEFVPKYPRQVEMTGGLNLGGILLGLISRWMEKGPFLGVSYDDWAMFRLEEQAILCSMLIQRRNETDQTALFKAAVVLLADPEIECWIESYFPEKAALGTPLAQMGRTLALGGVTTLHRPKMTLKIPRDRTRDACAEAIEARLAILQRLFLPVHIEMHCFWEIDKPVLGKSAYLKPDSAWPHDNPYTRGARLVPDAPDPEPIEAPEEDASLPPLWEVVITVDPSLYTHPHPGIDCPADTPERVCPIFITETLVGRKSTKRNIYPDIPIPDPGISHAHMRISAEQDGSLSVTDLNSINRTYLNGREMPPDTRLPFNRGDEVTLGCWTRITLRTRS